MSPIQFQEVQKLKSPWIWILSFSAPVSMTCILIYQLATGVPVGNHPLSNTALLFLILFISVPVFILLNRLKFTIIINEEKVFYGFNFPTPDLHEIVIADISECYLTKNKFNNIGYHISVKNGLMFNLNGKMNLHIIRNSGEKIMLGTNKGEELKAIFEKK